MAKSGREKASGYHSLQNKSIAIFVGIGITALVVLSAELGWLDSYELISYDKRMVWLNNIGASKEIVHIDIDDGS